MRAHNLNHYYSAAFCIAPNLLSMVTRRRITLILILLTCAIALAYAQPISRIYTKESGLSSSKVTCTVQDHSGYLWVGTHSGLNRYDGNLFKTFKYDPHNENSMSSNRVNCLAVDKLNRIWIGHGSSVTRYNPADHRFTRFTLEATVVTFIFIDSFDKVWVGIYGDGLVVLNSNTGAIEKKIDLKQFLNKDYTQGEILKYSLSDGVAEDLSGNVWIASRGGLYKYDRKLDKVLPAFVLENTPGKIRDDYFTSIVHDRNGGFWLASQHAGISYYSPTQKMSNFSPPSLTDNSGKNLPAIMLVIDIAWKNDHELWVLTNQKEKPIGTFDIQTKTFSFLNLPDIIGNKTKAHELFDDVFVDRNGVTWFASKKFGLFMIDPRKSWDFKMLSKTDSTVNYVSAIVEDPISQKKFLSVLKDSGGELLVSDLKDDHFRSYKFAGDQYTGWEYILDLVNTSGDSLWVVWSNHIRLFDKIKERWIELPQLQKAEAALGSKSPNFYKMIKASSGDYWIATHSNGVYKLSSSDLSLTNFKSNPADQNSISSNSVYDLLEDKMGRVWFASMNSGISIFDPSKNTFKRLGEEKKGSMFLPTNSISAMDIDRDGNIWLATKEVGMIKVNVVSRDSLNFVTFAHDALTSPIDQLKIDGKGRIWFNDEDVKMLDPGTMNIKSFDKSQEFLGGYYTLHKSNGRVLLNGPVGSGIIDEHDLLPDTTSSPLVINTVKVFGNEIYPVGSEYNRISQAYDQNSLAIEFAAIDFVAGQKILYSYKLEGAPGSEWSAPSSNRTTEFADLAGGDYIFKVKTANQEGIWSKEKTLLYIHIDTPFWETDWFYILVVFICIAVTALLYFYQVNRNKRISQLQLKALHTQMRPHFIFNCLSAINGHIVKFETAKASEFLIQFSRLMRGILENSTESWITLEQEIETLRLYLVMEGLRFEDKFSYNLEVEEGIDPSSTLIPSMILQPYLENSIGHGLLHKKSGIGKISIKFLQGNGNLKCIIEDNGIGRERARQIKQRSKIPHKSLGLQITSERLQLLQGRSGADIEDLKNEMGEPTGTRIIVMLMTKKVGKKDLVSA